MFVTRRPLHVKTCKSNEPTNNDACNIPSVKVSEWSDPIAQDYLTRKNPTESVLDSYRISTQYADNQPKTRQRGPIEPQAVTTPHARISSVSSVPPMKKDAPLPTQSSRTLSSRPLSSRPPSSVSNAKKDASRRQQSPKPPDTMEATKPDPAPEIRPPNTMQPSDDSSSSDFSKLCKARELFIHSIRAINLAALAHAKDKQPPNYSRILKKAITEAIQRKNHV